MVSRNVKNINFTYILMVLTGVYAGLLALDGFTANDVYATLTIAACCVTIRLCSGVATVEQSIAWAINHKKRTWQYVAACAVMVVLDVLRFSFGGISLISVVAGVVQVVITFAALGLFGVWLVDRLSRIGKR